MQTIFPGRRAPRAQRRQAARRDRDGGGERLRAGGDQLAKSRTRGDPEREAILALDEDGNVDRRQRCVRSRASPDSPPRDHLHLGLDDAVAGGIETSWRLTQVQAWLGTTS